MALANYVKFLRGTPAAYLALANTTGYDKDTLYFISEVGATQGALYLGSTLIAGEVDTEAARLGDLADVLLNAGLSEGQILAYNGTKWENKTLDEVISEMKGASADAAGEAGLVPVPTAGQHNHFLRGDGSWVNIAENSELATQVGTLENILGAPATDDADATGLFAELDKKANASTVSALNADVQNLSGSVATLIGTDAGKSVAEIATAVLAEALIADNAAESLDTLQEIAAWIQQHPEDAAEMSSSIAKNAEDIIALQETVGTLSTDLGSVQSRLSALQATVESLDQSFVTLVKYNNEVGDITKLYTEDENGDKQTTNVVDEILALQKAMQWEELK